MDFEKKKVEATKCEVCNVQRALPKEDLPSSDVSSDSSDIPLVNSEVIKVCNSFNMNIILNI